MSTGPSDAELLALLRREDQRHRAFRLLVERHQRPLYAFLRRMLTEHEAAQDVLQNTFLKAWNGIAGFRGDSALGSWLHRIAHNEAISHIRRERKGRTIDAVEAAEAMPGGMDHGEHITGEDIQQRLQHAVMRLPDKQRAVFVMRYFQEMPYAEMSTITGTSEGALKSSYHIAVKKIESWLAADQTSNDSGSS
jgi:RNA polymerase sigma-70 factor (ECF subfamily)